MEDLVSNEEIQYEWKVLSVDVKDFDGMDNVVYKIVWQVTGTTMAGFKGTYKTSTEISPPELGDINFVRFDQLSLDDVIGWIKKTVDLISVSDFIDKKIKESRNFCRTISYENLPWNR